LILHTREDERHSRILDHVACNPKSDLSMQIGVH
jgi:hypothetical protein